jgi:DNA-binding beta-propeller fold protein YncE
MGSGPFLYVGGFKLKMYALGSSTPMHVAKMNPSNVLGAAIALDLHGHLCEASGEISYPELFEYDAATLKFVNALGGVGDYPALVADRLGYLYASTSGAGIEVYAPGCLHKVNVINRGAGNTGSLVFDQSGNLYKSNSAPNNTVSIYAPTKQPGHMKLIREIHDGLSDPGPLAIGPTGDLFVANYSYSEMKSYITVYPPGDSKPTLTITKGIKTAGSLAVDSTGQLYVAVPDYAVRHGGWISVYAPGGTQPISKVPVHFPVALALDPSDNLYVADQGKHNYVLVYSPGATKLLQTIKLGLDEPSALLIGSP